MPRRSPKLSLAAAVVAAIAMVSCGGSMDGETVSGSSRIAASDPGLLASDTGTLTASGDEGKVPVCHKGTDRLIPEDAVPDHLGHGDTLGECTICPCFSAELVVVKSDCGTWTLVRKCQLDPFHKLNLTCVAPSGEQSVSIFRALADGEQFFCGGPGQELQEVTEGQYKACAAIIENSGTCPA